MRRLLLLVIVVVLALPSATYGQTRGLYQLRPVSVDEYIQAISHFQFTNDQSIVDFQDLHNDFVRRYLLPDPTISFAQIVTVYNPTAHFKLVNVLIMLFSA